VGTVLTPAFCPDEEEEEPEMKTSQGHIGRRREDGGPKTKEGRTAPLLRTE